jgi:hypothetical protein
VNPIITSKIPCLVSGGQSAKTQTRTKLAGIGRASGRKSRAQCQAAIIMKSAVAFATLNGDQFGNAMHIAEVDSLVLQRRYVICPTEFAGSKLSNASLGSRHRLPHRS